MILSDNPPNEIPLIPQDWHFKVLAEREKRLASGEAHLMELDDFIDSMRRTMPDTQDWHADVLHERLEREERGEAVWRSVDETFDRIRSQITARL